MEPEMPFIQIQKGFPWREGRPYRIPQMVKLHPTDQCQAYGDGLPSDHPCPDQWDTGQRTNHPEEPMTGTVEASDWTAPDSEDYVWYYFRTSWVWVKQASAQQLQQYLSLVEELKQTPGTVKVDYDNWAIASILHGRTTKEMMTKAALFVQTMWDTVGGYPEDV